MAEVFARDAGENCFGSRRGVWELTDVPGVVVLYNNNPYAAGKWLREDETQRIRERLVALGCEVLAYAEYPPPGEEDAGYTYAMIVRGDDDLVAVVASHETGETWKGRWNDTPPPMTPEQWERWRADLKANPHVPE